MTDTSRPAIDVASPAELLEGLTPPQAAAVAHRGSPLLVVAGAGSGKTRVLTRRIAHLLATGDARPHEILAITFTNKAAGEMRERVAELVGPGASRMVVATFHSACLRMLRANASRIGFDPNFTVYDALDSRRLIELVMADAGIDTKKVAPRAVASMISEAKAKLQSPQDFASVGLGERDPYRRQVAEVYVGYQSRLAQANAMDFDDLLMRTVQMLQDHEDILFGYQDRFRHILIDEFQDTNAVQNRLVALLGAAYRNVCVVGDSDQSIYRFRAADITNILEFERTFPDATTIVLEQNFRSTQNILDAANAVIANNPGRPEKRLFTTDGPGPLLKRYRAADERDEGMWIANEISRLTRDEGLDPEEIAILYRTNAQSRAIEEELVRAGIPYKMIGGIRFYERREIKDVLAYLRFLVNPTDEVAAKRIINTPKRGIGATSVAALDHAARAAGVPFGEAMIDPTVREAIGGRAKKGLAELAELVDDLRSKLRPTPTLDVAVDDLLDLRWSELEEAEDRAAGIEPGDGASYLLPGELVDAIIEASGYRRELEVEGTHESEGRLENLEQLVSDAASYETVEDFLSMVAVVADSDQLGEVTARVSLMTLHIAKGLEYQAVFLIGMEEGVFPHSRSFDSGDPADLEEERRLAYVGITRARRHLTVSHAWSRTQWGQVNDSLPSRFLAEIPDQLIEELGTTRTRRASRDSWSTSTSDSSWELPKRHRDDDEGGTVFGGGRGARPEPPASTGAHLLGLEAGETVVHDRWGEGRILKVSGAGDRATAVVRFPGVGDKTLMLAMAPLKRP